jgi:hypothetical protein
MFTIFFISNGNETDISFLFRKAKNFMMEIDQGMVKKFCLKIWNEVFALFIWVRVSEGKLNIRFLAKLKGKWKLWLIEAIVLKWTKMYVFFDFSFYFLVWFVASSINGVIWWNGLILLACLK